MAVDHPSLALALAQHHDRFAKALQGLPRRVEQRYFAHVLLCRLWLIHELQQSGYLGNGDRWYLHNQLSRHSPHSSITFFQSFLQPLCHQGLGLPEAERPRPVQQLIGTVPYLGSWLFAGHPWEQNRPELDLPDEPIEQFLGWLAEIPWQPQRHLRPRSGLTTAEGAGARLTNQTLAHAEEIAISGIPKKATTTAADLASACVPVIDEYLLTAVSAQISVPTTCLSALLETMTDEIASVLVHQVLPNLSILDPACGSGRLLLTALERLQWIYDVCWQQAKASPHPTLQAWVQSLRAISDIPEWAMTRQILTQNLFGVDLRPEAIAIAQTQLWLCLLAKTPKTAQLPILPNLDFNIVHGHPLVGFIQVNEESFDQVVPKPTKAEGNAEIVLQGNLLQPLAAASYRDTLAEKQIRIEHYRAQTVAMGAEGGVPDYVQREFLRDRIEAVNAAAQQKLDNLLWQTFSRQLGIVVREPQPTGKIHKRLLTETDVAALNPFHWGFFFNSILSQGGFDLILTQPPTGTLRPQVEVFYQHHEELFEQAQISLAAFRRSRRQILQQQPQLADCWRIYAGRIGCLRDYVKRSSDYSLSTGTAHPRSIALRTLYQQRCQALSRQPQQAVHLLP
ncbi:MAG: hypothetical protein ACFBSG_07095 [Leptolyngbyaceae cyanobacterium]